MDTPLGATPARAESACCYMIVQKANRHAVYARGFYTLARAERWLAEYDPRMWMDKTIQASDLEIVPDSIHTPAATYTTSRREVEHGAWVPHGTWALSIRPALV